MDWIDRRVFVAGLAGASLMSTPRSAGAQNAAAPRFGFDDVVRRARDLATAPLAASPAIPEALAKLDPALARDIKFRPERGLLAGADSQFRLQTLHLEPRGRPVTVNLIRDGIATPIPYAAGLFDYGKAKFERPLPLNLGFAGFRMQFPLNDPRRFEDTLVFEPSGDIVLLGRGQRPGARLRAASVNAGLDSEERPFFREFWIEAPTANAGRATILALLDGDSITGAFKFEIAPGVDTRLEVTAAIYPRRVGGVLGLAPMTSRYFSGRGAPRGSTEFQGDIHDSDGLALFTGAREWLWRPLRNPIEGGHFEFLDRNPRGYGLVQRDRAFDHYQDLDAGYEARPSYWLETRGDWGDGKVELLELPGDDGEASNVFAAWVSGATREPGKPIEYAYVVHACLEPPAISVTGRAINTFQANGPTPTEGYSTRRFLIDFAGGELAYRFGDPASVEIVATASNGRVVASRVVPNPRLRGFRAIVDVEAATEQTADIRVILRAGGKALTETWTMPWSG